MFGNSVEASDVASVSITLESGDMFGDSVEALVVASVLIDH